MRPSLVWGPGPGPGSGIVALTVRSTVLLIVLLAAAVAGPDLLGPAVAVVSVLLFFAGLAALGYALLRGARRSRYELVTVSGLFGLQGCAPTSVRRTMLGAVALQFVVALAAAGIRIYTLVSFGILAPTFGLGLIAVWAARYGEFALRGEASLWQDDGVGSDEEDG